jgi:hypothetical protein
MKTYFLKNDGVYDHTGTGVGFSLAETRATTSPVIGDVINLGTSFSSPSFVFGEDLVVRKPPKMTETEMERRLAYIGVRVSSWDSWAGLPHGVQGVRGVATEATLEY